MRKRETEQVHPLSHRFDSQGVQGSLAAAECSSETVKERLPVLLGQRMVKHAALPCSAESGNNRTGHQGRIRCQIQPPRALPSCEWAQPASAPAGMPGLGLQCAQSLCARSQWVTCPPVHSMKVEGGGAVSGWVIVPHYPAMQINPPAVHYRLRREGGSTMWAGC